MIEVSGNRITSILKKRNFHAVGHNILDVALAFCGWPGRTIRALKGGAVLIEGNQEAFPSSRRTGVRVAVNKVAVTDAYNSFFEWRSIPE